MNKLISMIERNVIKDVSKINDKKIAISLSSGYDSNLLLKIITEKFPNKEIWAFTVNGKLIQEGKNVKFILKNYPKVKWVNIYPKNIVASIPIIAKYTKGRLFKRGIFVQYFLAKELNKRNIKHIILADGADQILDRFRLTIIGKFIIRLKDFFVSSRFGLYYQRFYKIPIKASGDIFKNKLFKYKNDPELDTIIYKGLLTFNYFGIVPHYSFVNSKIIVFCKNLSFLNFRKMYYRFFVKKYLGKNITSYINKIPGAFDIENFIKIEYLILLKNNKFFLNYVSKDKILKFCKNRKKYYNQIYQLLYLYYS